MVIIKDFPKVGDFPKPLSLRVVYKGSVADTVGKSSVVTDLLGLLLYIFVCLRYTPHYG